MGGGEPSFGGGLEYYAFFLSFSVVSFIGSFRESGCSLNTLINRLSAGYINEENEIEYFI